MRRCNRCGLISDERNDVCVECGIALEELEYKWWQAENSTYRKEYGVLPELNFCGQEGFDLIQAPPVQHSEFSKMRITNPKKVLTGGLFGMSGLKGMLKGAGNVMMGGLAIASGKAALGVEQFAKGIGSMYVAPIKNLKDDKDISELIMSFENDTWDRLYFLKNFTPVSTLYGDEYYVGMIGVYSGFKVYSDGTYFEGLFVNDMPSIGVEIKATGEKFIGNYENGEKHAGITLYTDNSYYSGTYMNGYRSGEGAYLCEQYFYSGQWDGGCREGVGMEKKRNGECFIGQWQLDRPVK